MDMNFSQDYRTSFPPRSLNYRMPVAGALAGTGFAAMSGGLAETFLGHLAVAYTLAAAVQAASLLSIQGFKSEWAKGEMRRWRILLFNLLGYAPCALICIALSFSSFFKWTEAERAGALSLALATRTIITAVDRLETQHRSLQALFEGVAARSSKLYEIEVARGSTCGFRTGGKEGDVARFRTREAMEFKHQRDVLRREVEGIRELASDIRVKRYSSKNVPALLREFETVTGRVNAIIEGPALTAIASFVEGKSGEGARIEGLNRLCVDPLRESELDAVATEIERIKTTPKLGLPEIFDPADTATMTRRSAAFIGQSLARFTLGTRNDGSDIEAISRLPRNYTAGSLDAALPPDRFPLVITLLIEILLLVLIPPRLNDAEWRSFWKDYQDGRRPLFAAGSMWTLVWLVVSVPERESIERLYDPVSNTYPPMYRTLAPNLLPLGLKWLLIVRNEPHCRHLTQLAHGLARLGDARLVHANVGVAELPPTFRREFEHAVAHDHSAGQEETNASVQVWTVSQRFTDWIRCLAFENQETP